MRVTKRKVSRFFVDGKGFANAALAYKFLAKKEIGKEIEAEVSKLMKRDGVDEYSLYESGDTETRLKYVTEAFDNRYPHEDCLYNGRGVCRHLQMSYQTTNEPAEWDYAFSWCKAAYKRDIDERAYRLREEDEAEASK